MLAWPVRIATVVALSVLSYGWGDWFASGRPFLEGVLLAALTALLLAAVARLFRPGGLAAFALEPDRAPAVPVAATGPAAVAAPRPEPTPLRARPRAPARDTPTGGSLWAGERRSVPAGLPLDLNAASAGELAVVPGIGRAAAARIVAHRELRGPFRSLDELAGVEGFDDARVARVAGRLRT